jgi:hypothetical protein
MLQRVSDMCERLAALSPLLGGITPLCQMERNATISTMLVATSNTKRRSTRSDRTTIERSRSFHMIRNSAKTVLKIEIKPVWCLGTTGKAPNSGFLHAALKDGEM